MKIAGILTLPLILLSCTPESIGTDIPSNSNWDTYLGDNARTMAVCEAMLERGFYVQGIRHPSVPRGSARLRITPMATHTVEEIDALADALVEVVALHPETGADA
jgi:7-keto-8-aminopelargonate synthetase-like enzyme